jgi:hypothetical protein
VVGKKEHALGKAEVHGAMLATVSHRTDEHRRELAVAEMAMCPLPWLGYSKWEVDKVREMVVGLWPWLIGRWCNGEHAWPRRSARR